MTNTRTVTNIDQEGTKTLKLKMVRYPTAIDVCLFAMAPTTSCEKIKSRLINVSIKLMIIGCLVRECKY